MKKVLMIILLVISLSGCTNISNMSIDDCLSILGNNIKSANTYRVGYKLYIPSNMQIDNSEDFIEVITKEDYIYYLYVDALSYYNDVTNTYKENEKAYFSQKFDVGEKTGYIEINNIENDKYIIELMFNYSKIEVIVRENDINIGLINAINIVKNIQYNDIIIENYFGDDILNHGEQIYDIFDSQKEKENILGYE